MTGELALCAESTAGKPAAQRIARTRTRKLDGMFPPLGCACYERKVHRTCQGRKQRPVSWSRKRIQKDSYHVRRYCKQVPVTSPPGSPCYAGARCPAPCPP